jgi:penicillin amidase
VLSKNNNLSIEDQKALQVDVTSLPAQTLIPFLKPLSFTPFEEALKNKLLGWDFRLEPNSIPAAIYVAWEKELLANAQEQFIPDEVKPYLSSLQLKRILDWIETLEGPFTEPKKREAFLVTTFQAAIADLKNRLGEDPNQWQYGQAANKHTSLTHALGSVANAAAAEQLNLAPLPRGGNGYTPGSTGSNYRQSSGASFRMIVSTGDWDTAVGTNAPGQSGDPESPFYDNLYKDWAEDVYFPVYFSKQKIQSVTYKKTLLTP